MQASGGGVEGERTSQVDSLLSGKNLGLDHDLSGNHKSDA